ncbi:MAG: NUDIX domain-containing protein [Ktedonobacterales bacterium]|nr:NUDIX domain-containing protein [Ktedonobacterales bacterium]
MNLTPLNAADLAQVHALHAELGDGTGITAAQWDALTPLRDHLATALGIDHAPASAREPFVLLRHQADDGAPLVGPRWWFHLLGLRHGAIHIVLTTPQGFFVAQRRSFAKDSSPGALDVAVSGHIGTEVPLTAAWREMAEEVGLAPSDLVAATLQPLFEHDINILTYAAANPPYLDREHHWIYTGSITAAGLAQLRFRDGEVTALLLAGPSEVARLHTRCLAGQQQQAGEMDIANGLFLTLPIWVAAQEHAREPA